MARRKEPDWLPEIQKVVLRKHLIVFDREALCRHALGIAERRDAETAAESVDGEDGGNVDELRRQEAEDIAHEIDPAINLLRWIADDIDDDTDTDTDTEIERGYTFWYSSADVDEDPGLDTFTSPLMYNTEIDVGEKLVRMKLDGSTDVVTVTKITPNCLAVEEETDGLYYLI